MARAAAKKPKNSKSEEDTTVRVRDTVTMEPVSDNVGSVTMELESGLFPHTNEDEDREEESTDGFMVSSANPVSKPQSNLAEIQAESIIETVMGRLRGRLDSLVTTKIDTAIAELVTRGILTPVSKTQVAVTPKAHTFEEACNLLGIPASDVAAHRENEKGQFVIVTIHGRKHFVQKI